MSEFKNWTLKKDQLKKAQEWQANKSKVDSQDGSLYVPSITVGIQTIQYCGQAYAGANNYHACDESLVPYLRDAVKKHHSELVATAITLMQKDADELALKAKDEVKQLAIECGLLTK